MENYKSNSHKSKAEESDKKLVKVVNGSVRVNKKNGIRKFRDAFLSDDASNIKSYILLDVLIPAIKKAIQNIVKDGIDILLDGDVDRSRNNSTSRVSYGKCYDNTKDRRNNQMGRVKPSGYEDVMMDNRGEAEDVLDRMDELIDVYGMVSVGDYYDLIGITPRFTDNKYGWTNLRNAKVIRTRDGWYTLKLPKTIALD